MKNIKITEASLTRIFFARLIDLILMSASFFIFDYLFKIDNYWKAFSFFLITIIVYIFYFVIFPFFMNGSTIGKLIFRLHLLNDNFNKSKLNQLFWREFYFIFIPYIFYIICQFVRVTINHYYGESANTYGYFIYRIGTIFYSFWMLYICLTIFFQKEHLSAIDAKFKTRVFYYEKVDKVIEEIVKNKDLALLSKNDKSTNVDFPGNINLNELEKIESQDYKEIINKKWKKHD